VSILNNLTVYDAPIEARCKGLSLGAYIHRHLGVSSALLKELKRTEKGILINGIHTFTSYVIQGGEHLTLTLQNTDKSPNVRAENLPLNILFEDRDYIVINKPPGLPTHPSAGSQKGTLANALAYYFRDAPFVIRAMNRLDRDTGGIVLVAKHKAAASHQASDIQKEYCGIVTGCPTEKEGRIDLPILREFSYKSTRIISEDGQRAVTNYRVEQVFDGYSYLTFHLETGRTHQIRIHMKSMGHPLLGDAQYGGGLQLIGRQALHCKKMRWQSPFGKQYDIDCPLPEDMARLLSPQGI